MEVMERGKTHEVCRCGLGELLLGSLTQLVVWTVVSKSSAAPAWDAPRLTPDDEKED